MKATVVRLMFCNARGRFIISCLNLSDFPLFDGARMRTRKASPLRASSSLLSEDESDDGVAW